MTIALRIVARIRCIFTTESPIVRKWRTFLLYKSCQGRFFELESTTN